MKLPAGATRSGTWVAATLQWSCLLAAMFLPALALLPPNVRFSKFDWMNQIWLVNYFGEYFRQHHAFPSVINTRELVGAPYPVFYGYLFFPLLGLCSVAWNGACIVRIFAAALWAIQFLLIRRLLIAATGDRFFSFCIAAFVTWAGYPMTNLYNRGAFPEFFGTGFLSLAVVLWFFLLASHRQRDRLILANGMVFFLVLAAGTHPITGLYGLFFFLGLMLLTASLHPFGEFRCLYAPLAFPAFLGLLCLSPWIWAVLVNIRQLGIGGFNAVTYYPMTLDSIFVRLSPIPVPARFLTHLADEYVTTDNLDSQISVPLLLTFAALARAVVLRRDPKPVGKLPTALTVVWITAVGMIVLSVIPGSLDLLGYAARSIQYAYRLVTYINLALLAGILLAYCCGSKPAADGTVSVVSFRLLVFLLCLAGVSALYKLHRAWAAASPDPSTLLVRSPQQSGALLNLPKTFYGADDYCTPGDHGPVIGGMSRFARRILFLPEEGGNFGRIQSQTFTAKESVWVATNIQDFKWNALLADGRPVPLQSLRNKSGHFLAASPPPGAALSYAFRPDPLWLVLNAIAIPLFLFWAAATLILSSWQLSRQIKGGAFTTPAASDATG
jgi:hypothetical protein